MLRRFFSNFAQRTRSRSSSNHYSPLEARHLLASIDLVGSELFVRGTTGDDTIQLVETSTDGFRVSIDNEGLVEDFAYSDVTEVTVIAQGGDDRVTNNLNVGTRLFGQAGNDSLQGGMLDDRIIVGIGNDILIGQHGDDFLLGAEGDDLLNGNRGEDLIFAGAGDDRVNGGMGVDNIFGLSGNNMLFGNGGDDIIVGGSGIDQVFGGSGNDRLVGNAGDDVH